MYDAGNPGIVNVLVVLMSPSGTCTNITITTIVFGSLRGISKGVKKAFADCGDTLNYTIQINNVGNFTALNVVFKDTIPSGTSFINGSFLIDWVTVTNANPSSGVTIPNIPPSLTSTITFSAIVQC